MKAHMPPAQSTLDNQILHLASQVIQSRGESYFQEQMLLFRDKLNAVGERNRQLAQMKEGGPDYDLLVRSILDATGDYYRFIGALPEDMRRLLLIMLEREGGGDLSLEGLGNSLGLDVKELRYTVESASLLSVQAIRPQQYIMQLDALTSHLATLDGEQQIRVGKRGNQPVLTTVTLDMPDHMRIEGGGSLSTYDKSIINGITSLIESGNTVFSIPMLYHAMTGRNNPTVDEQLADELKGKLEKMRRMILTIDLTEENEAHYLTGEDGVQLKIEDFKLEGYLLPLNKVTGTVNGKKAEMYQIIQHPPLYSYSKMKRQLASVKIALLSAPVNNNATTIPLKTYLLQRIELMKNRKNSIQSQTILFDSVYSELGAEDGNKTKKQRIRGYTETLLQHFVEQKYIQGYSVFKRGRSIAGVNIVL